MKSPNTVPNMSSPAHRVLVTYETHPTDYEQIDCWPRPDPAAQQALEDVELLKRILVMVGIGATLVLILVLIIGTGMFLWHEDAPAKKPVDTRVYRT